MSDSDYILSVDVIGAKELAAALKSSNPTIIKHLTDAINNTALELERRARANAPHKHGVLRSSLAVGNPNTTSERARVIGNNIQAIVGTKLKYARAQEAGTQGMTINVPNGRAIVRNGRTYGRTQAYSFKGNITPKWYMKKARDAVRPIMATNLEEAMKKIVDGIVSKLVKI